MALFKHLWKSFENDEKLMQTIYSFACEEYAQKGNEYKESFKVTTHGKEKAGHGLGEAYDGLDRLLNKFPDMEDKEYVVSCFAMYKLEFTHRFILYAQPAKYMVENKLPIDTKIPESVMFAVTRLDSDNNVGCSAFVCDYDKPEWTDEFFGEVSDFFKNKCCVTEAYKPLNISECENTGEYNVYDYIRSIYGNGMLWDKEEETYAREQHQKNKKASAKPKK